MIVIGPRAIIQSVGPFVKWAGGKTQLLGELEKYVPSRFQTYYEPFVGGGALFFHLQPDRAVLADSNRDLINAYAVVRDNVEELIARLSEYPYTRQFYYELRSQNPSDSVERAARFMYLNRTCFNGLYRVNKLGEFNVPMGNYVNPRICNSELLRACSGVLQPVTLMACDYQDTLSFAAREDFVYIDPPYYPVSRYSDFKRYTREFFYERDQINLKLMVDELVRRGCHVVASNSYCDFVLDLYRDYRIVPVHARRNINSDPSGRAHIKEVLIVCQ